MPATATATATVTPRARLLASAVVVTPLTAAHASVDDARDACARACGSTATVRYPDVARRRRARRWCACAHAARAMTHGVKMFLVLLSMFSASLTTCRARDVRGARAFEVHAYIPEYRDASRAAEACAHAQGARVRVLAFSAEFSVDGSVSDAGRALVTRGSIEQRGVGVPCAFDLVIGGGGRSGAFAAALRGDGAETAAREAAKAVRARAYDGVSFDWEYPQTASDWQAYAALVCATKRILGDGYRVSFSIHPSADTFEYVKTFRDITDCADAVYVMAYDFSPTNERLNDGHSSLSAVVGLLKYINLSKVVEDASKFMLGIPLYGRRVSNFGDAKTYEDLVSAMGDSFEPSRTFVDGVVFNSVEIVRAKVREAKKFGFGGVMVWELGQDVPIEEVGVSLFDAILEEAATVDDGEREYLHEDL